MMLLYSIFFALLGVIVGSFLNVVIYRMNTGRGMGGRSHCGTCNKTLTPFELIPIVSYLIQKGKCRGCRTPISPRYVIIETISLLVFLALYFKFAGLITLGIFSSFVLWFGLGAMFFSLFLVISGYDAMHKIVPDRPLILLGVVSILSLFVHRFGGSFVIPGLMDILAGPIVALPFFLIWALSRGRLMGFGDVKIAMPIGWFLGISSGFAGLILSFWIGAVVAIILLLLRRTKYGMKTELPFVPYLAIGAFIAFIYNLSLFDLIGYFSLF